MERFSDYLDKDLTLDQITKVIKVFFVITDKLLPEEKEDPFMPFDTNLDRTRRVVFRLLNTLPKEQQFSILYEAFLQAESTSLILDSILILGAEHGKYDEITPEKEDERFVSTEQLEELETITLDKLEKYSTYKNWLDLPWLRRYLAVWLQLGKEKEIIDFVKEKTVDDINLARFLSQFVGKGYRHSIADRVSQVEYVLNPKWIIPYLDIDETYNRIQSLEKSRFTSEQVLALEKFVEGYKTESTDNSDG